MKAHTQNIAAQLFESYCQAYNTRDLKTILNLFVEDCHLWGTAIDEERVGLEAVKSQHERDWAQSDKSEIQVMHWIDTPYTAPFIAALCKAIITIEGREHIFEHLRGTIGVTQDKGEWRICHMHASFPDFRNAPNNSFPA